MNRQVAKNIFLAQVFSDSAKGEFSLFARYKDLVGEKNINPAIDYGRVGYTYKDRYIMRAIDTIITKPNTGFSFFVTDGQITAYLVYFQFGNFQVSFHSWNDDLKKYMKADGRHYLCWDEMFSRNNCRWLYDNIVKEGGIMG